MKVKIYRTPISHDSGTELGWDQMSAVVKGVVMDHALHVYQSQATQALFYLPLSLVLLVAGKR